jgi:adenylosuccinate synthase
VLHHAIGNYTELAGWREDLSECRTESDLPAAARDYLRFIADFIKVPIALIGVGPGREEVIWTEAGSETTLAGEDPALAEARAAASA